MQRLGGQVRVGEGAVLGWDMTAALALAEALGVDRRLAAEWLPGVEAEMVRAVNDKMQQQQRGREDG